MILRILLVLIVGPLAAFLAESGRISWAFALPTIFVALLVSILLPRIKGVKISGTEIELFEQRAREISDAEIRRIRDEVTAQKESLRTMTHNFEQTERSLKLTQKQILNSRTGAGG